MFEGELDTGAGVFDEAGCEAGVGAVGEGDGVG